MDLDFRIATSLSFVFVFTRGNFLDTISKLRIKSGRFAIVCPGMCSIDDCYGKNIVWSHEHR